MPQDLNALGLQGRVQADLLGDHGFAFDHLFDFELLGHIQGIGHRLFSDFGKIYLSAVFMDLGSQLLENEISDTIKLRHRYEPEGDAENFK